MYRQNLEANILWSIVLHCSTLWCKLCIIYKLRKTNLKNFTHPDHSYSIHGLACKFWWIYTSVVKQISELLARWIVLNQRWKWKRLIVGIWYNMPNWFHMGKLSLRVSVLISLFWRHLLLLCVSCSLPHLLKWNWKWILRENWLKMLRLQSGMDIRVKICAWHWLVLRLK